MGTGLTGSDGGPGATGDRPDVADADEVPNMPPAAPGWRWALVRDDRLTNRLRSIQIPVDAPDPVDPEDSPEMLARTRALVADLLDRKRTDHHKDGKGEGDPVGAGEGP